MDATNGAAATANAARNGEGGDSEFKLKFCTVCASNQNRCLVRPFFNIYIAAYQPPDPWKATNAWLRHTFP